MTIILKFYLPLGKFANLWFELTPNQNPPTEKGFDAANYVFNQPPSNTLRGYELSSFTQPGCLFASTCLRQNPCLAVTEKIIYWE